MRIKQTWCLSRPIHAEKLIKSDFIVMSSAASIQEGLRYKLFLYTVIGKYRVNTVTDFKGKYTRFTRLVISRRVRSI